MESKLPRGVDFARVSVLLIEPVWNRNLYGPDAREKYHALLLIEPVWNRNAGDPSSRLDSALLIEPVWNRNRCSCLGVCSRNWLLIEPVWNRNLTGCG